MNEEHKKKRLSGKGILRCLYTLTLCLHVLATQAQQTYPVQVYTQLIPPYTPHIPAYYTGSQAKLKVMLVNTDMQQPLASVYLRMKITSSMFSLVNPPEVYTPQIELQAGMPLTLSPDDLVPYFKRENLRVSGGQSEFFRTQMLPDNFYRFGFEVYEAGTNRLVSNPKLGFAQAMIAAGEPPVLNLPQKGAVIKESGIPSIMFSWTPRHMNSVAAAYGSEYEISLVEIYDKQVAPEAAFDYSRVLYTETTKSTSFIHTAAQPVLIPGMRYAWRVQVKAREGMDEISIFKNNGFSAVSWFDYTADCKTVQSCGAVYENGHVNITWQETGATEYTVEYRRKGTSKWYTGAVAQPELCRLYNLQAGEEYEYRIGTRCVINDAFRYSETKAFKIPGRQESSPNCGLMPDVNLSNQTPAQELQALTPVLAGDFPVFITKVSGSGKFTGEGYVSVPYLQGARIAVTFKDIVVNTDNRLVSGFFETKYDANNNNLLFDADQYLTGGKGVGDIRTGEEKAAFKVDYAINPEIKALPVKADGSKDEIAEGGDYTLAKGENDKYTFVLTDSEGNEHKAEADTMPATIEDKDGNTYEVNEKGEVKPVSKNSD
ncbi:MAG: fibronectin type III domain-containing protein, partial [Prevotella sp.]|nr:fibronectin type III domain-containing protein [Prevotella sp.]